MLLACTQIASPVYLCRMNPFENLRNIALNRRSTKPGDMNGKEIDPAIIMQLLELADWAPTHGRTEPWRFIVFEKESKQQFCLDHAELYRKNTSAENFTQAKYDKLLHLADTVSHIVLVYVKRSIGKSIPASEEFAAVAAATQNILLGAASHELAVLWSTGGMTHHPSMKTYLGLGDEDVIMGLLYMGYADVPAKEGKRNMPLEDKITWKS